MNGCYVVSIVTVRVIREDERAQYLEALKTTLPDAVVTALERDGKAVWESDGARTTYSLSFVTTN